MTLYSDYIKIGNNKYYHRDLEARSSIAGLGSLASKNKANLTSAADVSGILPIANGGTASNTPSAARSALEVVKCKSVSGGSLYVSTTGNDNTGDGTSSKPFRTINYAVEYALYLQHTIINVSEGTYNENVVIINKIVSLQTAGTVTITCTDSAVATLRAIRNSIVTTVGNFIINSPSSDAITLQDSHFMAVSGNIKFNGYNGLSVQRGSNAVILCRVDVNVTNTAFSCMQGAYLGFDANIYGSATVRGFNISNAIVICHSSYTDNLTTPTLVLKQHGGQYFNG